MLDLPKSDPPWLMTQGGTALVQTVSYQTCFMGSLPGELSDLKNLRSCDSEAPTHTITYPSHWPAMKCRWSLLPCHMPPQILGMDQTQTPFELEVSPWHVVCDKLQKMLLVVHVQAFCGTQPGHARSTTPRHNHGWHDQRSVSCAGMFSTKLPCATPSQ